MGSEGMGSVLVFQYRPPGGTEYPVRMPRKPRIEYPGAAYHVMCRGDRREPIFLDDQDRLRFLENTGSDHRKYLKNREVARICLV